MNKKEQIALIDASFMKLSGILQSSSYNNRYYRMCEAEERDHRRWSNGKYNLTVKHAARLFYVRNVVRFLTKDENSVPSAANYFSFNGTVFASYALFCEFEREKFNVFSAEEIETICALDYSELVA